MSPGPRLSVVIATRHSFSSLGVLLDVVLPQVRAVGGEVVIVGGGGEEGIKNDALVRFVPMATDDLLVLRARGFAEAGGEIIAIGEDHAFPMAGWAAGITRAHAEHPDVPIVIGCLVNATNRTAAARANFLAFAAPFAPPMPSLPDRPPPISVVSIKRDALTRFGETTGSFETTLLPQLFAEGKMVADDRIQVEHHQAFGIVRSIRNGFGVARASYGYAYSASPSRERRKVARWALTHIAQRAVREARAERARARSRRRDLVVVAMIGCATALGAAVGTLVGAGRAPFHIA